MNQIQQVLADTRDIIKKNGWAKNHDEAMSTDKCCLVQALALATENDNTKLYWPTKRAVEKALPDSFTSLVTFNDFPYTTEEDIYTLLEKAATIE